MLQRRPVLAADQPVTASEAVRIVVWVGTTPIVAPAIAAAQAHVVHLSDEVSRLKGPLQRANGCAFRCPKVSPARCGTTPIQLAIELMTVVRCLDIVGLACFSAGHGHMLRPH